MSTSLADLGIDNTTPIVNPPTTQSVDILRDPSVGSGSFISPDPQVDLNQQITNMTHERANMNQTPSVCAAPPVPVPVKTETFLNYFPFLTAFNINEDTIKSIILGIVLLMIIQMPEFRSALLGVVPLLFKSNNYLANLTVATSVVALFIVIQKFMT